MNKKNISIIISVFTAAFVVSILGYITPSQNIEVYSDIKISMPEDIFIRALVDSKNIEKLKEIDNIKEVGLQEAKQSIKIKNGIYYFTNYNKSYFLMQYKFIKKGRIPDNSKEVVISDKTAKDLDIKIGDTINIEFGEKFLKGKSIIADIDSSKYNKNEEFKTQSLKKYTVSGFYNTINPLTIQGVIGLIENTDGLYYPCIKVADLQKIYTTQETISKTIGADYSNKISIVINKPLLRFLKITENGWLLFSFIIDKLVLPIMLIAIFTFMIKNIFNIWAIYKIKELSLYKSIGAANFQIYSILLKNALKISVLPLLAGEFCGLFTIKMLYGKVFSLFASLNPENAASFSFHWIIIIVLTIILLIIIILAVTFPARSIAKIEIIQGLKENITTRNYKKKHSKTLFKEMQINNRKILKPMLIIMITGFIMIECMFGISAFGTYNIKRNKGNTDYNFFLKYQAVDLTTAEIVFNKIIKPVGTEKHRIIKRLDMYVDTADLKYSKEFLKTGFDTGFKNKTYYPDEHLLNCQLTGISSNEFAKISKNKADIILVNIVQKNPKAFYKDAVFIPYLDDNTSSLNIKLKENLNPHKIKISRHIHSIADNTHTLGLYSIQLITSIENFENITEALAERHSEYAKTIRQIYYNLEMKIPESEMKRVTDEVNTVMGENIQANEKYKINNAVLYQEAERIEVLGMLVLISIVVTASIFLNIANTYSSSNLYFFTRKREIGTLLSAGMADCDLASMLKKEMCIRIIISLALSLLFSIAIIGYIVSTIPYIDTLIYIKLIQFKILLPILFFICVLSYLIYISAMKKITSKNIIDLIKHE